MSTVGVPPRPSRPQPKPKPKAPEPCCCPACLGLKCLDRPRYFAGQLLTEADFTSEQDYLLAKNRLHNRYLHGVGVVCGLEVVCSNCDGWVTVQPGYALDPCGNDIIVCEPAAFNVIDAIRECCGAQRKRRSDCDPYRPPQNDACKEGEQTWCITLEYQERETRGQMPLRNSSCGCGGNGGCSCGGGGGCGCGGKSNGKSHKASHGNGNGACSCKAPKPTPQQPSQCEPTRIFEGYKLCVIPEPKDCSSPERGLHGPLIDKIRECVAIIKDFYAQFSPQVQAILHAIVNGAQPNATPAQVLDACCRMRTALIALINDNDFLVHCDLLRSIPPCTDTPPAGAGGGGGAANIDAIKKMNEILEQMLIDCVCRAFLPPCSSDPCDDRLILACVTVKNGRVIRICNFACRKFAGAFPSFFYWLSVFPIFSQIAAQIRRICCEEGVVRTVDPAGSFLTAMRASGYAAPQMLSDNVDALLNRFSLENLTATAGPGAISLPSLLGLPLSQVAETLQQSKIGFSERVVHSAAEVPVATSPLSNLFASTGGHVVVYRAGDEVVGFGAYDVAQELTDTRAELAALRSEVQALKAKPR